MKTGAGVPGPWCVIRDVMVRDAPVSNAPSPVSYARDSPFGPLLSMAGRFEAGVTIVKSERSLDLAQRDPTLVRRQEYVG